MTIIEHVLEFIFVLLISYIPLHFLFKHLYKNEITCKDGKGHDFKFFVNSKGRTGDLGFGIKSCWNVDTYICTKCGKEKNKENY